MRDAASARQEGIYYRSGERPPGFYALLLLRVSAARRTSDLSRAMIHAELAELWGRYVVLKDGIVPDLPGVRVPHGNLQVLLGFGAAAFELGQDCKGPARFKQPFDAVSTAKGSAIA